MSEPEQLLLAAIKRAARHIDVHELVNHESFSPVVEDLEPVPDPWSASSPQADSPEQWLELIAAHPMDPQVAEAVVASDLFAHRPLDLGVLARDWLSKLIFPKKYERTVTLLREAMVIAERLMPGSEHHVTVMEGADLAGLVFDELQRRHSGPGSSELNNAKHRAATTTDLAPAGQSILWGAAESCGDIEATLLLSRAGQAKAHPRRWHGVVRTIRRQVLGCAKGGLTVYASYLAKLLGQVARDYETTARLVELLVMRKQGEQAKKVFNQAEFENDQNEDRRIGMAAWLALATYGVSKAEQLLTPHLEAITSDLPRYAESRPRLSVATIWYCFAKGKQAELERCQATVDKLTGDDRWSGWLRAFLSLLNNSDAIDRNVEQAFGGFIQCLLAQPTNLFAWDWFGSMARQSVKTTEAFRAVLITQLQTFPQWVSNWGLSWLTPVLEEETRKTVSTALIDKLSSQLGLDGGLIDKDNYDWRYRYQRLVKRLEALRGLQFKKAVPVLRMDEDGLRRYFRNCIAETYPGDSLALLARSLKLLPFHDRAVDPQAFADDFGRLEQEMKEMKLVPIEGYYDRKTGTCYIDENVTKNTNLEVRTVAHELAHALQHQHGPLDAFSSTNMRENLDRWAARQVVLEGEATLVGHLVDMVQASADNLVELREDLTKSATIKESTLRAHPLAGLGGSEILPYLVGGALSADLLRRLGWRAIEHLWRNPPQSSEQILHPTKLTGPVDHPTGIEFGDPPKGWRVKQETTLGEFQLRLALVKWLDDEQLARTTIGWDGDRFAFLTAGDQCAIVLTSFWDSLRDTREFGEGLQLAIEQCRETLRPSKAWDGCEFRFIADGYAAACTARGRKLAYAVGPYEEIEGLVAMGLDAEFSFDPGDDPSRTALQTQRIQRETIIKIRAELAQRKGRVDGRRYEHDEYGFRVELPRGWAFTKRDTNPNLLIQGQSEKGDFFTILATDYDGKTDLEEVMKFQVDGPEMSEQGISRTTLAGQPAWVGTYLLTKANINFPSKMWMIARRDGLLFFEACVKERPVEQEPAIDQIVQSIELLDQSG